MLSIFFDFICFISLVGIWPRFIEPKLLCTTKKRISHPLAPPQLRIVVLSDLHFTKRNFFWKRVANKVHTLKPDLLLFLGDYGNFGHVQCPEELCEFLRSLPKTKLGAFAILGNHDYTPFVAVNKEGEYAASPAPSPSGVFKGFQRLFFPTYPKGIFCSSVDNVQKTPGLRQLLETCGITVLHNQAFVVQNLSHPIQLVGVGEYMCKQMDLETAFSKLDPSLFTLLLMHNPDGILHLQNHIPAIILSGHTHGAQINLPYIWKRFVLAENPHYCRGEGRWKTSWYYIARGLGSAFPFRLFSPPEILCLDIHNKDSQ